IFWRGKILHQIQKLMRLYSISVVNFWLHPYAELIEAEDWIMDRIRLYSSQKAGSFKPRF
ncbi:MAG TPA: hypothetical protein DD761_02490, partial [Cyanobacteria bacterium UBA11691]|nr:hypothetical protein [Cyanobacteria bacterium UBA11691]